MMFGKPTSGAYSASNDLMREMLEYAGDRNSIAALVERQEFANAVNRVAAREFRELVSEAVRARFHPKTYSDIEYQTGVSTRHNILVDAVDKVNAAVWPSARTWVEKRGDGGTWSDDDDPRWAAYLDACDVDSVANRAAWLRFVHAGVYLWPYVVEDERTGMRVFKTRVLTPEHFDVEACDDDATSWEAVSILGDHVDHYGQRVFTRKRWDAKTVSKWHRRAGDTTWTLDDVEPNPYGVVPGAFLQGEPDRLWGGSFGPPLYEATIAANVAQSFATLNSNAQVKMLAGVFDDMPQRQRIVHGGVLSTGAAGGELQQMLDFQLDNAGFRDAFITSERRSMAVMMGLPPDEFETTTIPPSGESLKLRYMGRQHMAERYREPVKAAVREWLETGLAVLAYEVLRAPDTDDDEPLPPVAGFEDAALLPPYVDGVPWSRQPFRFRIDVRDLQYPETQDERQKRIEFDLARGYTTDAHEYKMQNPDTLDASAELVKNRQANALVERASGAMTKRPQANAPFALPAGAPRREP